MAGTHGKRYMKCLEKVPKGKVSVKDAVAALKSFPRAKFDATVELTMHLGIDTRQAEQALRGSVSLPHGIGATRKVVAFCDGADVEAAKAAGAIEAGADELVDKISKGWTDFDVAIATPAMMKIVSKLGRVLGPQGKMPSPKAGTVVTEIAKAVTEYSAGKVEYRNDDGGNIHVPVGKDSFEEQKLVDNIEMFINYMRRLRPSTAKGIFIKKACISSTMTPAVLIDVQ